VRLQLHRALSHVPEIAGYSAAGGFEGELGVELDPSADHHLEWLPGADTELVSVKLAADVQDEVTAVAPV